MYSALKYRTGNPNELVNEYFESLKNEKKFKYYPLDDVNSINEDNVLAFRFTSDGGQGDIGGVEVLCYSDDELKILYGNFYFGKLNLGAVIEKLSIINTIYRARSPLPPYPYGENVDFPENWQHIYMGLQNHYFIKTELFNKTEEYIKAMIDLGYGRFSIFGSVAWFCGLEFENQ